MTQQRVEQPEDLREIREGADVFGSDGEQWGRVEAVGAKYLTITEGILGRKQSYLPIALVARGEGDLVVLGVPVEQAKAQALSEEPGDEPIDTGTEAIPVEEMERDGVAASDYVSGVGAAQLVVKPVMAD
jgi:hypothetical protein